MANLSLQSNPALFFVDPRVEDYAVLLQGLNTQFKVFILDLEERGVAQIGRVLAGLDADASAGARSVHVLCHGAPGCLYLGAGELSLSTLDEDVEALSAWFPSKTVGNELLLYGCHVAAGDAGEEFIGKLHGLMGVAIAASTTPVGCAGKGGNWELDITRGEIVAELAIAPTAQAAYAGILADPVIQGTILTRLVSEDDDRIINNLQIQDADGDDQRVTLSVTDGILELATTTGLTFVAGADETSSMTIEGTLVDINNALGGIRYTPNADYFGSDAIEVTTFDGTSTIAGTVNLSVTPVNDDPVADPSTQAAVDEGSSVSFTATDFGITDVDNDDVQIIIKLASLPSKGILKFNGAPVVAASTFSVDQISSLEYFHDGTQTTSLGGTLDSFEITAEDGAGGVLPQMPINITINPVNQLPSATGTNVLFEGQVDFPVNLAIADPDQTAVSHTVEILTLPSDGILSFNGNPVTLPLTLTSADLPNLTYTHDGNDQNAGFPPDDSFDIKVIDDGGGTATPGEFTTTVELQIKPNNDNPEFDPSIVIDPVLPEISYNIATNPNGREIGITSANLLVTDVDSPTTQLSYRLTSAPDPTLGSLQVFNGSTFQPIGIGDSFTQEDIDSGRVKYVFHANGPGTFLDSFDFEVRDGEFQEYPVVREGGIYDAADANIAVTTFDIEIEVPTGGGGTSSPPILPNQPPTITSGTLVLDEAGTGDITSALLQAIDSDNVASELVYTIGTAPTSGTIKVNGIAVGQYGSFTQADIDAGNVSFEHFGDEDFIDEFRFTVTDGSNITAEETFFFDVTPQNDAPTLNVLNNPFLAEAGTVTIDNSTITFSDVDGTGEKSGTTLFSDLDNPQLTFSVVSPTANGTLEVDQGSGFVPVTSAMEITLADLTSGNFRYIHDGTENFSDSFDIQVNDHSDDEGATNHLSAIKTVNIDIASLNDDPVFSSQIDLVVSEGGLGTINGSNALTGPHLHYTDTDNSTVQRQYFITTETANGVILLNGQPLATGSAFTQDDLDSGRVTYQHDGSENYTDVFLFDVRDGGGNSVPGAYNITVNPANDAPDLEVPGTQLFDSDAPLAFGPGTGNQIKIIDDDLINPDTGLLEIAPGETDVIQVSLDLQNPDGTTYTASTLDVITSNPNVTITGSNGSAGGTLTLVGPITDVQAVLDSLTVQVPGDEDRTLSLEVTVNDNPSGNANGGNGGPDPDPLTPGYTHEVTQTIDIQASNENDAPIVTNPSNVAVDEDTAFGFTGANAIQIDDIDAFDSTTNTVTLNLADSNGILTLPNASGVTVTGSGTDTVIVVGSKDDINAALLALQFTGNADFNDESPSSSNPSGGILSDTLNISVNDGGNTGLNGGNSDPQIGTGSVAIVVNPVNDPPAFTNPAIGTQTVDTGSLVFSSAPGSNNAITFDDALDLNNGGDDNFTVTLSIDDVGGTLTPAASGATVTGNGNNITIQGSKAQVEAALEGLTYTPSNSESDESYVLTVNLNDNANGGPGPLTDSQTININVSDTNDAPVIAEPGAQTAVEDVVFTFSAANGNEVSISDEDDFGGNLTTVLSVGQGTLTLTDITGLVNVVGNGSGTVTITGPEAAINAALANGLDYLGNANYFGPDQLVIDVNDLGNTGAGGPLDAIQKTVDITVEKDTDADGIPDITDIDDDNDGILDSTEAAAANGDTDGIDHQFDIDADNDGISDNIEAQSTANYIAPSGSGLLMTDINQNGLDDNYEVAAGTPGFNPDGIGLVPANTDGDATPDYLDSDSDNDGFDDIVENGMGNTATPGDTDGDGLLDVFEAGTVNDGFDVNDAIADPNPATLPDTDGDVAADGNDAVAQTSDLDYRDNTVEVTITANDPAAGEPSDNGQFTVNLSQPSSDDVTVTYTVGGTAIPTDDYTPLTGTVVIPAGQTSAPINVTVANDNVAEVPESVVVTLTNASSPISDVTVNVGSQDEATVNITDDDDATVSIGDATIAEGGDLEFAVTLSNPVDVDTVITYSTADGTATDADGDYTTATTQTLTILAGDTTGTITVPTSDDNTVESDETLTVTLDSVNASGRPVTVADDTGDGTIIDNDSAVASIASTTNGAEPGTDGQFTVSLTNPSDTPTEISYTITGGSAASGGDFTPLSGTVTIPANTTSVTIDVPVVDDGTVEITEDLELTLGTVTSGNPDVTIDATADSATINITDDDTATVSIGDTAITEGGDLEFPVTLSAPVDVDTVIIYSTADGTATTGDNDYTGQTTQTLTIPAGQTTGTITVATTADSTVEVDETLTVTLDGVNASGRPVTLTDATGDGTITNDDTAEVTIAATNAAEPGTDGQFTVSLTNPSDTDTVVNLNVAGDAAPGVDYDAIATTVTIPAGQLTATIDVTVIDDSLLEDTETVTVTLDSIAGNPSDITVGTADSATVNIADDDVAEVTIAATDANGIEPGDDGQFTVTLSQPSDTDTVVNYNIGGDATNGSDYGTLSGQVTIPAGQTTATIDVPVLDDPLLEDDETVTVTLDSIGSGDANITIGSQDSDSVTIADTDTAEVNISANDPNGGEPGDDGQFTVTLSAPSDTDTEVSYTIGGDATAGDDYQPLTGTVTIPAGQTSATIDVDVVDNSILESDETVSVTLDAITSGDSDITIGVNDSDTVTLSDDDVAIASISATDGAEPTADGQFTVSLTNPSDTDTVISYTVGGDATAGDDYTPLTGTVTVPAGATTATIDVEVLDDSLIEDGETVTVTLDTVTSGDDQITIDPAPATVNIADDDTDTISIVANTDGGEPSSNGQFTVSISQPSDTDTVVSYSVTGDAVAGGDYTALSGSVTIPAGATSASIDVAVIDDNLLEDNETVTVTLDTITSGDADISIGVVNSDSVTLTDDDTAEVTVTANDPNGAEPSDNGQFTVAISQPSDTDTVVTYSIGGDATPGTDYQTLTGTVTIPAGQTSVPVDVTTLDDGILEDDETVTITLDSVAGDADITIGSQDTDTVTIADTDTAEVNLSAIDGAEPGTDGQFTVTLSNPSDSDTVVNYSVAGDATPGGDYTTLTGSVTIPAGQTSATFDVDVIDDLVLEDDETVVVTLDSVVGDSDISIGSSDTETVTLADNDTAVLGIATTDASEPGTDGQFVVTLTNPSDTDTVVSYSVTGDATPGGDYQALTGTVTVPAGQMSVAIPVEVIDDSLLEDNETVTVTLDSFTGDSDITISPSNSGTVNLADDDTAELAIAATNASEPGTDGQFTVSLTNPSDTDTVVTYTVGGDATPGSDYQALTGTVTIPAGQTSADIDVTVLDDSLVEDGEAVTVTLASFTGDPDISIGVSNSDTVTIADDDSAEVSITATGGSEPGSNGQFVVSLTNPSDTDTVVSYTIGGDATPGSDYQALTGTVTIPAGQTSAPIDVAVLDDVVIEDDETVTVTLNGITGDSDISLGTTGSATVTIADDDLAEVAIAAVTDASEPGTDGQFVVTLTQPSDTDTVVTYSVTGDATPGSDYQALSGSITIPAGATLMPLDIAVIDDLLVEDNETVTVTLDSLTGDSDIAIATNNSDTVNVGDDDAVLVSVVASDPLAAEPSNNGQFTIAIEQPSDTDTVIEYSITGTATGNADYDATPFTGTITIPANQTSVTLDVSVLEDTLSELDESVVLTLDNITSGDTDILIDSSQNEATVTILADTDGDNIPDVDDFDDDNDGILDTVEENGVPNRDTDGDGVPDSRDLDADNDGINDIVEAGHGADDLNNDGIVDGPVGTDGVPDAVQADPNGETVTYTPLNSDNDPSPDFQDLDSDNDSLSDLYEGGSGGADASPEDAVVDGIDSDGDGILDAVDDAPGFGDANNPTPPNADPGSDNLPDYRDIDSDGDGVNDIDEASNGSLDGDGDGVVDDPTDNDADGIPDVIDDSDLDGTPDADPAEGDPQEYGGLPLVDTDGDGVPDIEDLDDDNDGILDTVEELGDPDRDTDGDGVLDRLDLDSDNDGINDLTESQSNAPDSNGDGIVDGPTVGTDGVPDAVQTNPNSGTVNYGDPVDSDNDGQRDFQDLDSDNDSISDLSEGGSAGSDANGDGVVDGPDSDGDGLQDSVDGNPSGFGDGNNPALPNADGDANPDYLDIDSNGDGLPDIVEAGNGILDGDRNGVIDNPTDADNDGILDVVDDSDDDATPDISDPDAPSFGGIPSPGPDADGDGIPNAQDLDDDNDGIPDTVEAATAGPNGDTDGDGIPDRLDLDSDNDGINDVIEAGHGQADTDGDGMLDSPVGSDGIPDEVQTNPDGGTTNYSPLNSDSDGQPNFQDLDSDNDGLSDLLEGGALDNGGIDINDDGVLDGPDLDGDGIQDSVDGTPTGYGDSNSPVPPNEDGDANPDYIDIDSDNNGTFDVNPTLDANGDGEIDDVTDLDNDGIVDVIDDSDDDGIPDADPAETDPQTFGGLPATDTDGDGVPDSRDLDDDNDGILDTAEGDGTLDTDGDGVPDSLDLDADNDGILDVTEAGHGESDTDGDGQVDGPAGDNGLPDGVETTPESGTPAVPPIDSDGDGASDFQDLDSDNDGINDVIESGGSDPDGDGIVGTGDPVDADEDGIVDVVDPSEGGTPSPISDTDNDSVPDYLDLDSDNDGVDDVVETGNGDLDTDGDGRIDGPDTDGDGVLDPVDPADGFGDAGSQLLTGSGGTDASGLPDTNGDGIPDYQQPGLSGVANGGGGADTLIGGTGDDILNGLSDPDTLRGEGGNDIVNAGSDSDIADGGADDDIVNGGSAGDQVVAGSGNDIANGGSGDDNIEGNEGDDIANGGSGSDIIDGGAGNDILNGGSGDDVLLGNAGDDLLRGSRGNDRLVGGEGADLLTGGQGNDVFAYRSASEFGDMIMDFEIIRDRIDLSAIFNGNASLGSNVQAQSLGAHTLVLADTGAGLGEVAMLLNVNASTLDSNNFIF